MRREHVVLKLFFIIEEFLKRLQTKIFGTKNKKKTTASQTGYRFQILKALNLGMFAVKDVYSDRIQPFFSGKHLSP